MFQFWHQTTWRGKIYESLLDEQKIQSFSPQVVIHTVNHPHCKDQLCLPYNMCHPLRRPLWKNSFLCAPKMKQCIISFICLWAAAAFSFLQVRHKYEWFMCQIIIEGINKVWRWIREGGAKMLGMWSAKISRLHGAKHHSEQVKACWLTFKQNRLWVCRLNNRMDILY